MGSTSPKDVNEVLLRFHHPVITSHGGGECVYLRTAMANDVAIRGGSSRARARPARDTGDWVLRVLCALAGLLAVAVLLDIAIQVFSNAQPAI